MAPGSVAAAVRRLRVTAMKVFGMRMAGVVAAAVLSVMTLGQPGQAVAQAGATVHGRVLNGAGLPVQGGEVRLTTEKNPSVPTAKFEYTFPVDNSGNYSGADVKPGTYFLAYYFQGHGVDYSPQTPLAAGQDKSFDFDMSRKEYVDKMSPAEREQLEEYKKNAAATLAANAKIGNLNNLLKAARAANAAGKYDEALKDMMDATAAKPDEPFLWVEMGDAQLGQGNVAAKAAHDAKVTDASLPVKYAAAETSYQKALDLNTKAAKPSQELVAVTNNQLGQAYGKSGKVKEAATAYEAAAVADPPKASTYYYNEAATLFNGNDAPNAALAADKAIAADPTKVEAYYIKGQALVQNASVDPKTQQITAPPECIAAYQKYLELAPNGPHAEEIKGILAGIGVKVQGNSKPVSKKK
jgi:tetratricopeptide (TPR) repeat protein